jgi:hypothetical protein
LAVAALLIRKVRHHQSAPIQAFLFSLLAAASAVAAQAVAAVALILAVRLALEQLGRAQLAGNKHKSVRQIRRGTAHTLQTEQSVKQHLALAVAVVLGGLDRLAVLGGQVLYQLLTLPIELVEAAVLEIVVTVAAGLQILVAAANRRRVVLGS